MTARRVAIVGAGPKGTFALERLLAHCAGSRERWTVDLWDSVAEPGAGPVYRSDQPRWNLMNQPAGAIDMWWPGGGVVPRRHRLAFAEWSGADPEEYVARAAVGRYLHHGFELLLRHAPANVTVAWRDDRVASVDAALESGWMVEGASSGDGPYEHVMLATGHDGFVAEPARAGGHVAVRGFSLSFIDVALGLTRPGGGDATVWPFSRTGRPMLPKPTPAATDRIPGLDAVARRGIAELDALPRPVALHDDLVPVVARAADAALDLAAEAWGERGAAPADPARRLRHGLEVAMGRAAPGLDWALGHAWRALYPGIVRAAGASALRAGDRPAFLRLAAEMERVAFGPAPANTARLLELVDSGRVRLDRLTSGPFRDADAVYDAVLPGPGVGSDGPVRHLVADGLARVVEGGRGLEVDSAHRCIDAGGRVTPGLAAYGRPTEDSVVGNDTLSRTLHPTIDRWARSVAAPAPALVA